MGQIQPMECSLPMPDVTISLSNKKLDHGLCWASVQAGIRVQGFAFSSIAGSPGQTVEIAILISLRIFLGVSVSPSAWVPGKSRVGLRGIFLIYRIAATVPGNMKV